MNDFDDKTMQSEKEGVACNVMCTVFLCMCSIFNIDDSDGGGGGAADATSGYLFELN